MCIGGSGIVIINLILQLIQETFHPVIITLIKDGEKFIAAVTAEKAVGRCDIREKMREVADDLIPPLISVVGIDGGQIVDGKQAAANRTDSFRGIIGAEDHVTAVTVGNLRKEIKISALVQQVVFLRERTRPVKIIEQERCGAQQGNPQQGAQDEQQFVGKYGDKHPGFCDGGRKKGDHNDKADCQFKQFQPAHVF